MWVQFLFIVFSIAIGIWARKYNRDFLTYFLLSLFLTPLGGALILNLKGERGKKCPHCAEMIKLDAVVCKHCGLALPSPEKAIRDVN